MSPKSLLDGARRIHIIGVGGSGMSALARLLHERGHEVSGSDVRVTPMTEQLAMVGVTIFIGHDAASVHGADLVTFSPSVRPDNVELAEALRMGIAVARRGEVLGGLVATRRTLGVAGTHGKTTTSSMLASIAREAVEDPSYLIGEPLGATGVNAHFGHDDVLVMEADESYGTFTFMAPAIVGITNIEADHLDYYGTEEVLREAFAALARRATEACVVWANDVQASEVGAASGALTVGTMSACDYGVREVVLTQHGAGFTLETRSGQTLEIWLKVGGMHNVANAAVAGAMADLAGWSGTAIVAGLAAFGGVTRRFERRGEVAGVTLIDDYAHLPTEVEATVTAARASGFSKLVVIFQPHRYTRIATVGPQFAGSFAGADVVIVTPIYAAGEDPISGVSSALVSNAIRDHGAVTTVIDAESLDEAADLAAQLGQEGTVVLSLGAGDSTTLPDLLADRLTQS